jgi:hypothetical protein
MFKYRNFDQNNAIANIFQVDSSTELQYVVGKYQASLARLEIAIGTVPGMLVTHRLVFSGVKYMQLVSQWGNSHFSLAPPSYCIQLVRRVTNSTALTNEELLQSYALYIATTDDDVENLVLCGNGRISKVSE